MYCPQAYWQPQLGVECPDAEACQTGYPCYLVRNTAASGETVTYDPTDSKNHASICDTRHDPRDVPCAVAMEFGSVLDKKSNPEEDRVREALSDWWVEQSRQEMEACVPKAVEYGSTDLAVIGRALGRLMGRHNLTNEDATEMGIYFYLIGKLARWEDAIIHGRRVSDDTMHDASVYIKMQQRNRAVGGWPFAPDQDQEN